jgi:hypothetical protein
MCVCTTYVCMKIYMLTRVHTKCINVCVCLCVCVCVCVFLISLSLSLSLSVLVFLTAECEIFRFMRVCTPLSLSLTLSLSLSLSSFSLSLSCGDTPDSESEICKNHTCIYKYVCIYIYTHMSRRRFFILMGTHQTAKHARFHCRYVAAVNTYSCALLRC